ncbi:MAG: ABC transporter ATP-binding protein [Patescibacteria group bacterium]|jgi:ABC-2 type transport system ATP-binding protein
MTTVLAVKNLTKSYGSIEAVKGISFDIEAGEIFALIGPNGAGKSTTLRIVATVLSPTTGEIKIGEHDLSQESERVREIISYLPEEAGAYKNLKGIEYLVFMADLHASNRQLRDQYVRKAEEVCGLGNRLNDKVKTYSKGMTRKLLLARTVMTTPKLAILDEPTSGLDVLNAFEIRSTIKDLAKAGMAVLLSSHNMLEIEFLSDRVGIINKGKIHEMGTAKDLKKKYNANNLEEVFAKVAAR